MVRTGTDGMGTQLGLGGWGAGGGASWALAGTDAGGRLPTPLLVSTDGQMLIAIDGRRRWRALVSAPWIQRRWGEYCRCQTALARQQVLIGTVQRTVLMAARQQCRWKALMAGTADQPSSPVGY